jgi:hypothetical protein
MVKAHLCIYNIHSSNIRQIDMEQKSKRGRPPSTPNGNKVNMCIRVDPKLAEILREHGAIKLIEAAVPYYLNAVNSGLIDPP